MEDPLAELCATCRHRHHQGTKCGVCGHVGRCNIFPKMYNKSMRAAQLRFQYLTAEVFHDRTNGFYDIIQELRGQIFCYVGSNRTFEEEFGDREKEEKCSHLVAFMGDAPVCIARFCYVQEVNCNTCTVVIDRFGVVQSRRSQGLGRLCLNNLLEHVAKVIMEQGMTLNVALKVPVMEELVKLVTKLQEVGFHAIEALSSGEDTVETTLIKKM